MKTLVAVLSLLGLGALLLAADPPAKEPAPAATPGGAPAPAAPAGKPKSTLSPLLVKDLREVKAYCFGQTQATLKDMNAAIDKAFDPVLKQTEAGKLATAGAAIFVFRGVNGDPEQPFGFSAGYPVAPDTKAPAGLKVEKLPPLHAVTSYFTGPKSEISAAAGQFYADLMAAGYTPNGEHREVYLFWEADDSPNNVIEFQAGVAGAP